MATRYYLSQAHLEQLLQYINDNFENPDVIVKKPANTIAIANADMFPMQGKIPASIDIGNYIEKVDSDFIVTDSINNISKTYHFRGNVNDTKALQSLQAVAGDVYKVDNVNLYKVWNGASWNSFGIIDNFNADIFNQYLHSLTMKALNKVLYNYKPMVVSNANDIMNALSSSQDEILITFDNSLTSLDSTIIIPAGKEVTLNLNEQNIESAGLAFYVQGNSTITVTNGSITSAANDAILVRNGGTVIIDDADVKSDARNAIAAKEGGTIVLNAGNVESLEAGLLGLKDSTIIMNGGTVTGYDNCPIMGNGSPAGSANDGTNMNVVMNGGTLRAHITTPGYIACGVYVPNSGSFTMNGGEIISDGCGICMRGGTVNLNGGSIVATGESGVKGKVGDSRVVVGPYAVVYDAQSRYPAMSSLELNIAAEMQLQGTDGDIDYVLEEGVEANVHDNRV